MASTGHHNGQHRRPGTCSGGVSRVGPSRDRISRTGPSGGAKEQGHKQDHVLRPPGLRCGNASDRRRMRRFGCPVRPSRRIRRKAPSRVRSATPALRPPQASGEDGLIADIPHASFRRSGQVLSGEFAGANCRSLLYKWSPCIDPEKGAAFEFSPELTGAACACAAIPGGPRGGMDCGPDGGRARLRRCHNRRRDRRGDKS